MHFLSVTKATELKYYKIFKCIYSKYIKIELLNFINVFCFFSDLYDF